MKPRLNTSKKWTSFPPELLDQIRRVFLENFAEHFKSAALIVEGRIYAQEILFRLGYAPKNQLKQSNFEVSMDYTTENVQVIEKIHTCVDVAASLFQEFIETPEGEDSTPDENFPRQWQQFEFEGKSVFLQYTTDNTDLESQADAILGEQKPDSLVHEEIEEEDDDSLLGEGPKMFGSKGNFKKTIH